MWIRNKTAIHTTKFAAKYYEKKNTETHLVQPPFSLNVKPNVPKTFLQLIDTHSLQQTSYLKYVTVTSLESVKAAL